MFRIQETDILKVAAAYISQERCWTNHQAYGVTSQKAVKLFKYYISIIVQRDATQNSLFIILRVHCTCFGCQPHPSMGVHKTVTTASDTGHIFCAAWPRWREVAPQKNMTSTEGCSYSFV